MVHAACFGLCLRAWLPKSPPILWAVCAAASVALATEAGRLRDLMGGQTSISKCYGVLQISQNGFEERDQGRADCAGGVDYLRHGKPGDVA